MTVITTLMENVFLSFLFIGGYDRSTTSRNHLGLLKTYARNIYVSVCE